MTVTCNSIGEDLKKIYIRSGLFAYSHSHFIPFISFIRSSLLNDGRCFFDLYPEVDW